MASSHLMSAGLSPVLPVPAIPGYKRLISPSAQLSSAKRVALITTSPKLLSSSPISVTGLSVREVALPRKLAHVGPPRGHPSRAEGNEDEIPVYHNRHVVLPFNLRDPSVKVT